MAKIAWARGFFRAWILLALLWIIGAGAMGYTVYANPFIPKLIVATPSGGHVTTYDRYGPQQREFAEGVAQGGLLETTVRDGFLLYTRADIEPARLAERLEEARGVIDDYVVAETAARRGSVAVQVFVWALVPPLVVLLLGWALAWVLIGFRRTA